MLALAATCLVAALAAPAAGAAAERSGEAEARAAVTKKRLAQRIRAVDRRSRSNRRNVARLGRRLSTLGAQLSAAITGGDKTLDDKIAGIVGVVTPMVAQMADAAKALEARLNQLAAATEGGFLEVERSFGEVDTAVSDVRDRVGATEYGIGQAIVLVGATPTPEAGGVVVTPDIPDDEQQAQTHQVFTADNTGTLRVAYGVRSNESDGTGAGNPAASCRVYVRNEANDFAETPLQPVDHKSAVTGEDPETAAFPNDLTTTVAVTAGDTYEVGMACVDTTADPDDPKG